MGKPQDYLRRFGAIEVPLQAGVGGVGVDTTIKVAVQNYQNTGSSDPGNETKNINVALKNALVTCYQSRFLKSSPDKRAWVAMPADFEAASIYNVHNGKGGVVDLAAVLQLIVWCNAQKGSEFSQFWGLNDTAQWLRKYAKDWIGLDCLGFVVNYFNDRSRSPMATGAGRIKPLDMGNVDMHRFTDVAAGKVLSSLAEVREDTVIVYLYDAEVTEKSKDGKLTKKVIKEPLLDGITPPQKRHIALVDTVVGLDTGRAVVKLAESRGKVGLDTPTVTLSPLGRKGNRGPVFTVRRPDSTRDALAYLTKPLF